MVRKTWYKLKIFYFYRKNRKVYVFFTHPIIKKEIRVPIAEWGVDVEVEWSTAHDQKVAQRNQTLEPVGLSPRGTPRNVIMLLEQKNGYLLGEWNLRMWP